MLIPALTVCAVAFSLSEKGTAPAAPLTGVEVPRSTYRYSVLNYSHELKAYSSPPPTAQPF